MLYDSCYKDFKGKLCTRWMGRYEIEAVFDNGAIKLTTIDDACTLLLANGHCLKLYHHPTSRDSFIKHIVVNPDFEIISVGDSSPAPMKKIIYIYIYIYI